MTFVIALLALLLGLTLGFIAGCGIMTCVAVTDKNFRNYINVEGHEYDDPLGIINEEL